MTTILAIETATAACSAALWRDGTSVGRFELVERRHAERLLPMIDALLADAGVRPADLGGLAVNRGPGAFTSLRIGLAAARGMALALRRPCHAMTSFEILAAAALAGCGARGQDGDGLPMLAVLDTKRGDFYAQAFDRAGRPLAPPSIAAPRDLAALLGDRPADGVCCLGDGGEAAAAHLAEAGIAARAPAACRCPEARDLADAMGRRFPAGLPATPPPRPLYLHAVATGAARPGAPAAGAGSAGAA